MSPWKPVYAAVGQTSPVAFTVPAATAAPLDLTPYATVDLLLYDPQAGRRLWGAFADAEGSVTVVSPTAGTCTWTPATVETLNRPGEYLAQLKLTTAGGVVRYEPVEPNDWLWIILDNLESK